MKRRSDDPEFVEKKGSIIQPMSLLPFVRGSSVWTNWGLWRSRLPRREEWKVGPQRATFEPDYGRRGKLWAHGAFEPATGPRCVGPEWRTRQCQSYHALGADHDSVPSRPLVADRRQLEGTHSSRAVSVRHFWPGQKCRCNSCPSTLAGSI